MHFVYACLLSLLILTASARAEPTAPRPADPATWGTAKAAQEPKNEMPTHFSDPQPEHGDVTTLAWEDGVSITRDGLTLYSDYFQADIFKAVADKSVPMKTYLYRRGPDLKQDTSNPLGENFPWIHSDIVYATRASVKEPFSGWKLTAREGRFYNHGAPQGIQNAKDKSRFDLFVYTYDFSGKAMIMLMRDTDRALTGTTEGLPPNINDPNADSDNPHIERADPQDPKKLVLFFDSADRPGKGKRDMWFSLSADNGKTWADPKPVASLNTAEDDQQPHLFQEAGQWWLYFSSQNPVDGKLAIYRARQSTPNDWDGWTGRQLVVSAGTTLGVGEPSLTEKGDLSFVVVTSNPQGTETDRYDSDPWIMPALKK